MNKERILQAADAIESGAVEGLGYNQCALIDEVGISDFDGKPRYHDNSGRNCGTVACIAGWAATLAIGEIVTWKERMARLDAEPILFAAANWLDLDEDESDLLFSATGGGVSGNIPAAQAVRTLRHLAATGEVDWNV